MNKMIKYGIISVITISLLASAYLYYDYKKPEGAYWLYSNANCQLSYNFTWEPDIYDDFFANNNFKNISVTNGVDGLGWGSCKFNYSSDTNIICFFKGNGYDNMSVTLSYPSSDQKHYPYSDYDKMSVINATAIAYEVDKANLENDVEYFLSIFNDHFQQNPENIVYNQSIGFWSRV